MPPTPGSVTSSPSSASASSSREHSREAGSSGGASSATPRRLVFPSGGDEGGSTDGTGASGTPSGESSVGEGGSSQGETSAHADSDSGSPAEHGSGSGSHDDCAEHTAGAEGEVQVPGGLEAYVSTPSPGLRGRAAGAQGAGGTSPGGSSGVRLRRSRPSSSRSTRSTISSGTTTTMGLDQLPYEQAMAAVGPSAQRLLSEGHRRSDQVQGTPSTAEADASPPRRTSAAGSTGSTTGRVRRPQRNEDQEDDEAEVRSLLAAGASLGSSERRRRQRRRMGDAPPAPLPFSLSPPYALDALRRSWEFGGGIATPLSPQSATHHGRVQGHSVGQWQPLSPEATSGTAAAAAVPEVASVSPIAGSAHAFHKRFGGASALGLASMGSDEQLAAARYAGGSGGGGRSRSAGSGTAATSGLDPEGAPLVLLAHLGGGMRRSSSSSGDSTSRAAQPQPQVAEVHAYALPEAPAPAAHDPANVTAATQPPQPSPPSSSPDPSSLQSTQLSLATLTEPSKPPRSPLPPILSRGLLATTPVTSKPVSLLPDSTGTTPASATANRYAPLAAQEAKQRGKALLGRVSSRVAELGDLVQRVSASSTPVAAVGGGGTSPVSSSRGRANPAPGSFPVGPEPPTPVPEPTGVMATPVAASLRGASAAATQDTSAAAGGTSTNSTPAGGLRVEGSLPRVSGGGDLAAPLRQALEQLQLHGGVGGGAGGGGETQVLTGLVGMLDSLQGELRELQQLHQQTLMQQRQQQQQQPFLPAGMLVAAGVGSGPTTAAPATLTVSGTLVLLPQKPQGLGEAAPGTAPAAAQPHASGLDSPVAALQTPATTRSQADGGLPHVNSSPVELAAVAAASTSDPPHWTSGAQLGVPANPGHAPASSSPAPPTHSSTPTPSLTPWDRTPAQTPQSQPHSLPRSTSTTPSPAHAHATQAAAAAPAQPPEPATSSSSPARPSPPGSVDPRMVNILTQSVQAQLQGQLGSLQARISELQRQNERLLSPSAYSPATSFAPTPAPGPHPGPAVTAVATPQLAHAEDTAGTPVHHAATAAREHSIPRSTVDAAAAAAVRSAALAAALVAATASPREVPAGVTGATPQTPLPHAWGSWLTGTVLPPATLATPLVVQQQQQAPVGSAPHDALGTWPLRAGAAVQAPAGGWTPTAQGAGYTPGSTRSVGHAGTTPGSVPDDASAAPWSSDRIQGLGHYPDRFATPGAGGAGAVTGTAPVPLAQSFTTPQHAMTHGSLQQRDGAAAGAHSPLLGLGLGLSPADAQPYSPEELASLPPQVQLFAPPQLRAAAVAAAHEQHAQQRQKQKPQSRQQ